MDRQTQTHLETRRQITQALARNEFVLFYQPKVNMRTGEIAGAEALIRWQHPERGMIPPGEFLPLIEDDELIVGIGDWVMETGLAPDVPNGGRKDWLLPVSVNIAAMHLQTGGFSSSACRPSLDAHPDVPADNLELEVVETAALEGVARISRLIEDCRSLGVRFSLDDFGTATVLVAYLSAPPAGQRAQDRPELCPRHALGLRRPSHRRRRHRPRRRLPGERSSAKGVETAEHGELLLRLGCDLAQGYGIARPMPAGDMPVWAATWTPEPSWSACRNLGATRDDLPLTYAEVELRHWVKCVESCFIASSVATAADLCEYRFGQWYHGDGQTHYGRLPAFAALGPLHTSMHELGLELTELWANGHTEQARGRLNELQHALRDEVTQCLHILQEESIEARQVLRFPLF